MRLIDADALKARFTEELFERSGLSAQGIIDEAPTIAPSGDLISRADVFEIIDKAFSQPMRDGVTIYADICLMLNALPTHANSRSTHERDLISRQWLLDVYGDYIGDNGEPKYYVPLEVVRQNIKDAPSADAVHGEWIMHIDDLFPEESTQECSNCHEHETIKICNDNFCPNCGAKMDGERREP